MTSGVVQEKRREGETHDGNLIKSLPGVVLLTRRGKALQQVAVFDTNANLPAVVPVTVRSFNRKDSFSWLFFFFFSVLV